jgi:hypothetical protein
MRSTSRGASIVARVRLDQDFERGLEVIREAAARGLAPDRSTLDRLDTTAAVARSRHVDRVLSDAQVCAAEGGLLEGGSAPGECGANPCPAGAGVRTGLNVAARMRVRDPGTPAPHVTRFPGAER